MEEKQEQFFLMISCNLCVQNVVYILWQQIQEEFYGPVLLGTWKLPEYGAW